MANIGDQVNKIITHKAPWDILFENYGKNCPKCGKPLLRPRKRDADGNHMGGACMTKNCGYKEEPPNTPTKTQKQRQVERQARYNDLIHYFKKYSVFNAFSTFAGKTFNHYKPVDKQSDKAKRLAMRMAHDIAMDHVIHGAIFGSIGTGKTHLASAMFQDIEEYTKWSSKIQFIDIALAVDMRTDAIHDEESQKKIDNVMAQFGKSDLVIIDDLGAERNSDWGKEFIDKLMRIREDKSIIVTSNLSSNENGFERYSGPTLSRLRKHMLGNSITMSETPDYRMNIGIDDQNAPF